MNNDQNKGVTGAAKTVVSLPILRAYPYFLQSYPRLETQVVPKLLLGSSKTENQP